MRKRWAWLIPTIVFGLIAGVLLTTPIVKGRVLKLAKPGPNSGRSGQAVPGGDPRLTGWAAVEASGKAEGKVVMYSWSWTPVTAAPITAAFAARYGVQVEVVAGRGPQFLERLLQETRSGQRIGDIMEGAQTHLRNTKLAGLTISALGLPGLAAGQQEWALDPLRLDAGGHVIGYAPYILSPYVNTDLVAPGEEPRRWDDLLQPRWKGRMVLPNPAISTVPYYLDVLVKHGVISDDYSSRLATQGLLLSGQTPDSGELLAWGEAALSVLNAAPDMVPPLREGGKLKALDMEDGVLVNLLTASLLKDGPHPNASRLFLSWLLTAEGQEAHSRAKLTASIREGMADFTPLSFRLEPRKPIVVTAEDGERIARLFREQTYVPVFSPPTQ